MTLNYVAAEDPEVAAALKAELNRQRGTCLLYTSDAADE